MMRIRLSQGSSAFIETPYTSVCAVGSCLVTGPPPSGIRKGRPRLLTYFEELVRLHKAVFAAVIAKWS